MIPLAAIGYLYTIRRQPLTEFLFDKIPKAVPQPGEKHEHFLLPLGDIQQLVVRFLDLHLKNKFPYRNEFSNVDIAVIDCACSLQAVK